MSTAVAIITARGGSKRIPRKNIRDFQGQPIIAYSIAAARAARCFSEVMVSTDDPEIAEIALRYGALVPFMRSAQRSNDTATTAEVILEVLQEYRSRGQVFDFACCIYPTAPFVTAQKLDSSMELLRHPGTDAVVPVVRFGYPILRALKIEDDTLKMVWPENMNARSQDLPPAYHDAGQFYWLRVGAFEKHRKLFPENTKPLVVSELEVQDIDTEADWKIAEIKYQLMKRSITSS